MRECACPKELGNLRQELVTNTVTHRVGCLEQGVDPIGEDVRVLTAGGDEAPMHFCASTVAYVQEKVYLCAVFLQIVYRKFI